MRRINLLPAEERRPGLSALSGSTGGILLVGAAAILILVALLTLFCLFRINQINNRIADLDSNIATQNQRVQELRPYAQLQSEVDAKEPVADGVVRTRFSWDEFLQGLAFVIPDTTSLQTLTAQAAPVDIDAPVGQTLQPPGSVTFTGLSLDDYTNVADFVVRMNTLRFLAGSELESAELDRDTYTAPAINFEVASELVTRSGERESKLRVQNPSDSSDASAAENQYATPDGTTLNAASSQTAGPETRPGRR